MKWDRTLAEEECPDLCCQAEKRRRGHLRRISAEYAGEETKSPAPMLEEGNR